MTVESRQRATRARASNQQWAEMRRQQPRPTAPQSYQRPPDPSAVDRSSWWPVFWLLCLILVTALMVSRQLSTPPVALSDLRQSATANIPFELSVPWAKRTEPSASVPTESTDVSAGESGWSLQRLRDRLPSFPSLFAPSTTDISNDEGDEASGSRLVLDDPFLPPLVALASSAEEERWMMDFPPSEPESERTGPYRMRTWPNTIAWTSISWPADLWPPDKFRVETTMQINPLVPQGYGGFLVRYQDEQNYYLLQFDGEGHYRTTLRANGEWSSAKEWANSTAINLAGQPNTIAVEDGGAQLRVYANGSLIEEFSALLPAGHIGLIAGAKANGPIEVDYLGLTLYELY